MIIRGFAVIVASLLACTLVQAQDAASVNLRTQERNDPYLSVGSRSASGFVPAASLLSAYPSYSSAAASFDLREESGGALAPEEGDALRQGRFDAASFLRLDGGSAVDGGVSWRRGEKRNVVLNETADYELLQPYVLIDTLGGDMQHEQYAFRDAWMRRSGDLLYSAGGSYKAVHEYRCVDPRPRNVSSDLKAGFSLGRLLPGGALLSYAGYRKYFQTQDVTFVSNVGANTTLFHSIGLGSDYYRFRSTGIFAATRYAGHGFEAGLVGIGLSGRLHAGLSYSLLGITRYLSNQNEAPLSLLLTGDLRSFVSYGISESVAVEADVKYEHRSGTENVIDCAASGIYDDILSLPMYSRDRLNVSLGAVCRTRTGDAALWYLSPSLLWLLSSENYLHPASNMDCSILSGRLSGGFSKIRGPYLYDFAAVVGYGGSLCESCSLNAGEEKIREAYSEKFARLNSNCLQGGFQAFVQREVGPSIAVFARLSVGGGLYGEGSRLVGTSISIGISY